MAQRTITTILRVDDLDGSDLGESGQTIEFAWEGKTYAIDLSDKNAEGFRSAMGKYLENARHVQSTSGRGHGRRRASSGHTGVHNPDETRAARAWLIEQGDLKPESRGRISGELWEKYRTRGIPDTTKKPEPANAGAPKKAEPKQGEVSTAVRAQAKAQPAKATA